MKFRVNLTTGWTTRDSLAAADELARDITESVQPETLIISEDNTYARLYARVDGSVEAVLEGNPLLIQQALSSL